MPEDLAYKPSGPELSTDKFDGLEKQIRAEDSNLKANTGIDAEDARIIREMLSSPAYLKEKPVISGKNIAEVKGNPDFNSEVQKFKTLESMVAIGALSPEKNTHNLSSIERDTIVKEGANNYIKLRDQLSTRFPNLIYPKLNEFNEETRNLEQQAKAGTLNSINTKNGDVDRLSVLNDLYEVGIISDKSGTELSKDFGRTAGEIFRGLAANMSKEFKSFDDKILIARQAIKRGHITSREQYFGLLREAAKELPKGLSINR